MQDHSTSSFSVPVERVPVASVEISPETLQALRAACPPAPFDLFRFALDPAEWVWEPVSPLAYDYDEVIQPILDALLTIPPAPSPDETVTSLAPEPPRWWRLGLVTGGKNETLNEIVTAYRTRGWDVVVLDEPDASHSPTEA